MAKERKVRLAEKAKAQAAEAVSQAVETKPATSLQTATPAPEPPGPAEIKPGRGSSPHPKPRHEMGMELEKQAQRKAMHKKGMEIERQMAQKKVDLGEIVEGKGKTIARRVRPATAAEAASATAKVSKTARARAAFSGLGETLGKVKYVGAGRAVASGIGARAIRAIPYGSKLLRPMTSLVGKAAGPISAAVDIGTTAYAGYRAAKAYGEHRSLRQRAEKLKVPMQRRGFGSMAAEALLGGEEAEMDPEIKVWNPKKQKWD